MRRIMGIYDITDKADRIVTIDNEVQSSTRLERVPFRGETREFPVVRLGVHLPIYRMKNGRTQVEQYQYIEAVNQPKEFFENGEENISAQQAQHKILLKLAKDEKGPIYQELKQVATQRESLLLTSDGVVLNGNRRLAAMRDLFEDDARSYSRFSHIDAIILPAEANEKDLELLEAELQMTPETKLEYGWIERRLKLRRHVEELEIPRDQIKVTYRFKREEEINIELQQLELAEEYLEDYLGKPHAYLQVAHSEQLFRELEKAVRGKSGTEADARRLVGYLIVKEARNLGDRAYGHRHIFGRDFEKVMQRFTEDEDIELNGANTNHRTNSTVDDDDPLSGMSDVEQNSYAPLIDFLKDREQSKVYVEKLSRTFESVQDETKENKTKIAALQNVEKAHRILVNTDLEGADPDTFNSIKSQLSTIIKISEDLISKIDKITSENIETS